MNTEQSKVYIRSHSTGSHFGACAAIYSAGRRVVWQSQTWPADRRDMAIAECVSYAAQRKLTVTSVR